MENKQNANGEHQVADEPGELVAAIGTAPPGGPLDLSDLWAEALAAVAQHEPANVRMRAQSEAMQINRSPSDVHINRPPSEVHINRSPSDVRINRTPSDVHRADQHFSHEPLRSEGPSDDLPQLRPDSGVLPEMPVIRDAAALRAVSSRPTSDLNTAMAANLRDAKLQSTELKRELEQAQNQLVQTQADLTVTRRRYAKLDQEAEEVRRRLQRAEMDLPTNGARQTLMAILPALDNTWEVLDKIEENDQVDEPTKEAARMLRSQWNRAFAAMQVQAFDAIGQKFDPVVHEVIAQVSGEGEPGRVVRQVGRGYLLSGKLLRSARVVLCRSDEL